PRCRGGSGRFSPPRPPFGPCARRRPSCLWSLTARRRSRNRRRPRLPRPVSYQLLYTSAKRGLEPGKSGFCCVARDRDIPPDLALELERLSRFEAPRQGLSPRVLRHRIVELRSGIYHVLSRLQDAG